MTFGGKKRKLNDISFKGISSSRLSVEKLENRLLLSTLFFDNDPASSVKKSTPFELDESGQTVIESEIHQRNDKDCYVFTADRSGLISISMEAAENGRGSGLDSVLSAYNSKHKKIASNDDAYYRDTNSLVEFYVESGSDYYIKADGYKNSIGSYRITVESPGLDDPLWEDQDYSNKIKFADNIDNLADEFGNITFDAGIYPVKDKDFFMYTVPEDAEYSIYLSSEGSPLDSVLFVYNEKYKVLAKNDDISANDTDAQIEISAEQGDVLYIKASGWKKSLGTYTLTIENLDAAIFDDIPDETDPYDDTLPVDDGGDDVPEYIGDNTGSTGWLLSITISDYNGSANDLDGPLVDVELVTEVFTDYYSVPEENIYLINSNNIVDYEALDQGFEWLAENVDSDDYAFIYYSGHGYAGRSTYVNDNEGLLLPDNTLIYQPDLEGWLSQVDSDALKVVMVDSCFAGGLAELTSEVSNTVFIGSAGHDQYAWDEVRSYYPSLDYYPGGGVFANWINYGIFSGNADLNNNGFVGLLEAYNYADLNINLETGTGRNNQDPIINSSVNIDYALLLG